MPLVRGPTPRLSKQTKFLLLLVVGLWVTREAPGPSLSFLCYMRVTTPTCWLVVRIKFVSHELIIRPLHDIIHVQCVVQYLRGNSYLKNYPK